MDNTFKLEKQLHEQYAINNNAKVSSFVTFTIALFALFGFFGYIFAYSVPQFSEDGVFVIQTEYSTLYTLEIFFIVSLIVNGILLFLSILSIYLGYSQRRDHLICYNIRKKHYAEESGSYKKIFGESYNPTKKNKCNFIPDYFNIFYWLFFTAQIFVFVLSFVKLRTNLSENLSWSNWGFLVVIVMCLQSVMLVLTLCERRKYFKKYELQQTKLIDKDTDDAI